MRPYRLMLPRIQWKFLSQRSHPLACVADRFFRFHVLNHASDQLTDFRHFGFSETACRDCRTPEANTARVERGVHIEGNRVLIHCDVRFIERLFGFLAFQAF